MGGNLDDRGGAAGGSLARRAGVSRGAQQHHYPTKAELVAAAIEHLLERQRAEYEQAFVELPPAQRTIEGALDLLWSVFQGPTFTALLELAAAARTDDALRRQCVQVNDRIADMTNGNVREALPGSQPWICPSARAGYTGERKFGESKGSTRAHCLGRTD